MNGGRIYLLRDRGKLEAMDEQPYDAESTLQHLLAEYPDLLAGEQINSEDPRRWLLVAREKAVPGEQDGAARWHLDHLFLDQDAIPTLVEVKRSSNSEIRRQVVGQMLDYAANAVAHWPVGDIQARFEQRCQDNGDDPDEALGTFLDDAQEPAEFWERVETNLRAGKVRLIFVADVIPPELRRVIEFLAAQLNFAEVFGVEVRQFVGEGFTTLVPRVIGHRPTPPSTPGPNSIPEPEFWQRLRSAGRPESEIRAIEHIAKWSRDAGLQLTFQRDRRGLKFYASFECEEATIYPFNVSSRGWLALLMRWLKRHPPFDSEEGRDQLRERFARTGEFRLASAGMLGLPKLILASLEDDRRLATLTETLDWMVKRLREEKSRKDKIAERLTP